MRQTFARAGAVLIAVFVSLSIAVPALASAKWKEAYSSHHFYVGAPSLTVGSALKTSRAGRIVTVRDQGRTWCEPDTGLCYPVVKVRFNADTSICWSGNSSFDAQTNLCTGNYTLFAYVVSNFTDKYRFDNIRMSNRLGRSVYLCGKNTVNTPMAYRNNVKGWYGQWTRVNQ